MARTTDAPADHVANALATIAVGVLQLGLAISLSALIFSGPIADGAGRASSSFILGSAVITLIVGLTSRMRIVLVGAQDTAAIVLAAIAASMTTATEMQPTAQVPTVMTMIVACAASTGLVFWLIGHRRLTGLVRYLPWPVITGFTAGTGWLLLRGGVEVMRGSAIEFGELAELVEWDVLQQLLPGLGLAVLIVAVLASRVSNTWVSLAIVSGVAVFHLVGRSVTSLDRLEQDGWLIGPFPDGSSWTPLGPDDIRNTDWGALAEHALPILAVIAVSVVGVLLNLSGLEAILDEDIDMDHEVKNAGLANVGVAAAGGLIGWHLLGDTSMADRLGARGRMVSIALAAMFLFVFFAGPDLIGLLPRAVAGGVLAGLGLSMLVDWAGTTMTKLSRGDRAVSAILLVAIAVLGVLPGVAVGVAVAALAFIRRSSRIEPARSVVAAAGNSNVDRSARERMMLDANNRAILAVELQGFLFFGSTLRLRSMLEDHGLDDGATRFVVLDMARVTGLDSTAAAGLGTLIGRLRQQGIECSFSSLGEELADELRRNGVMVIDGHPDLEHGVAAGEDALLDDLMPERPGTATDHAIPERLAAVMERRSIAAGEVLITTGDMDRTLFFLEAGRLTTWINGEGNRRTRLRQVRPGAVLGEVAFSRGGARTADVIADTRSEVLVLTRERFDEVRADEPDLAIEIQQLIMERLANRLAATSAMVRDLRS